MNGNKAQAPPDSSKFQHNQFISIFRLSHSARWFSSPKEVDTHSYCCSYYQQHADNRRFSCSFWLPQQHHQPFLHVPVCFGFIFNISPYYSMVLPELAECYNKRQSNTCLEGGNRETSLGWKGSLASYSGLECSPHLYIALQYGKGLLQRDAEAAAALKDYIRSTLLSKWMKIVS